MSGLLWDEMSRADAFKAAPAILAHKYGIFGTTRPPKPLTTKRVREAFEKRAVIWSDTFSGRFLRNAGNIIRRSPSRIRDFGEAEHDIPA